MKRGLKRSVRKCIVYVLVFLILILFYHLLNKHDDSNNRLTEDVSDKKQDDFLLMDLKKVNKLAQIHSGSDVRNQDMLMLNELGNFKVINTVHYMWCDRKYFTFRNYLSVMSVWKNLKPDIIEFHQTVPPIVDKYEDWFEELKSTIPCLVIQDIPENWLSSGRRCGGWLGLAIIEQRGGIYIDENAIITGEIIKYRNEPSTVLFSKPTNEETTAKVSIAMTTAHDFNFQSFIRHFDRFKTAPEDAALCEVFGDPLTITATTPQCYHIGTELNPMDIFTVETHFGSLARRIFYGSENTKLATPTLPGNIPNIVHYIWFGEKELNFMMYLSMLSTLFVVNPEKVLVHTDGRLTGKLWIKLLKDKRIVVVLREIPTHIYGHKLIYAPHTSDIVRAEVLIQYGGIYVDWDVLWLKNPNDVRHTGYDTIVNLDHQPDTRSPEMLNLGVVMAKPNSVFLQKWQDSLIHYKPRDYLYNAVLLPYKIYEKYPEYLFIEKRLQVMCFRLKCHPTFRYDFKNPFEEQPFDWRTDVYSIHFTDPDPEELTNEESCNNGETRFSQMCKYILQHENQLPG